MTAEVPPASPMRVWVDAQLPPALAAWLSAQGVAAQHVVDLNMVTARDADIFAAARAVGAAVITKDEDFLNLLERYGPPPQVVWVTVGNARNAHLRALMERYWPAIAAQLAKGEPLVELAGETR